MDFDSITEFAFADQAAFGQFMAVVQQPDNQTRIVEAEARIMDRSKTSIAIIGTIVTEKE